MLSSSSIISIFSIELPPKRRSWLTACALNDSGRLDAYIECLSNFTGQRIPGERFRKEETSFRQNTVFAHGLAGVSRHVNDTRLRAMSHELVSEDPSSHAWHHNVR